MSGAEISGDLFALLGARLQAGRTFTTEEHLEGAEVAVIGHGLQARLFGADAGGLGATLRLDGRPHVIVGVAPEHFAYPGASDIWVPFPAGAAASERDVWGVGRLRSGVTVAQADAAVAAIPVSTNGTSQPPNA